VAVVDAAVAQGVGSLRVLKGLTPESGGSVRKDRAFEDIAVWMSAVAVERRRAETMIPGWAACYAGNTAQTAAAAAVKELACSGRLIAPESAGNMKHQEEQHHMLPVLVSTGTQIEKEAARSKSLAEARSLCSSFPCLRLTQAEMLQGCLGTHQISVEQRQIDWDCMRRPFSPRASDHNSALLLKALSASLAECRACSSSRHMSLRALGARCQCSHTAPGSVALSEWFQEAGVAACQQVWRID